MHRFALLTGIFSAITSGEVLAAPETLPVRVVSLDYCADQFLLKLLPRTRILAVSPDAQKSFSYMRDSAAGIRQIRPLAEDVLSIRPDLVIRSYGGGPRAILFFERAGIPVLQIPFANDIEGVRQSILVIAHKLGERQQGEVIVQEFDRRLRAIPKSVKRRNVLYMTSGGATTGAGTLVHDLFSAADLDNFETRAGWHSIPLERLAYARPDIVAAAFFEENVDRNSLWSAMRHPVARRQMRDRPTVLLQGAWTSCGGWFLADAIEALASVRISAE